MINLATIRTAALALAAGFAVSAATIPAASAKVTTTKESTSKVTSSGTKIKTQKTTKSSVFGSTTRSDFLIDPKGSRKVRGTTVVKKNIFGDEIRATRIESQRFGKKCTTVFFSVKKNGKTQTASKQSCVS